MTKHRQSILWESSVKGTYRIFNYVTQHFKMLFSTTVHSGELVLHLQIGVGVVLIFTHPWECNWFWTGQWTTCGELASLFTTYILAYSTNTNAQRLTLLILQSMLISGLKFCWSKIISTLNTFYMIYIGFKKQANENWIV